MAGQIYNQCFIFLLKKGQEMAQRGGAEEKGTLREVEKAEKFLLFQPRKKLLNHQRFWAGWIMNLPLQWSAG